MRILILTLHYAPLNSIASLRINAFAKYLKKSGCIVDIITRHYDANQTECTDMDVTKKKAQNFNADYIVKENTIYTNFDENNKYLKRFKLLPPKIKGLYSYYHTDIYHYGWIKYVTNAFEIELSSNKYNYIIASHGPPIVLEAANILSKKYKIPWIADFRDLFITEKDKGWNLIVKQIIQNKLLKTSKAILFATDGMKDYFFSNKKNTKKKSEIVFNGIDFDISHEPDKSDSKAIDAFFEIKSNSDLTLLHTGTLYDGQNISFFINNVIQIAQKNRLKISIILLGLLKNMSKINHNFDFIKLIPKVKHSTSLYLQKEADALLLPVWDGRYSGYSGKTFEYINSGNIVFTSPDPQNDLKKLIIKYNNIKILNNKKELEEELLNIYHNNPKNKSYKFKELSREYQVKKLLDFLHKIEQT